MITVILHAANGAILKIFVPQEIIMGSINLGGMILHELLVSYLATRN